MPTPIPFLWFDGQAEEAARFYTGLFPRSAVRSVTRNGPDSPGPSLGPEGSVLTVEFSLDGQAFVGLNGGPQYSFTEAISFQIPCGDQDEVDHYWFGLSEAGEQGPCGWLKDRFGVSWQVVPTVLPELLADSDPARAGRAMQAMLGMSRLVIAELRAAADGDDREPAAVSR